MFTRKLLLTPFVLIAALQVAAAEWQTDYAKALAKAKAENKRVLLDFTGSDWCGPCIQLNKTVFSTKEFRAFADKNLIFVEVDYPKAKKQSAELVQQNEKLAKEYGIDEKGYPTLVLLDPLGRKIRELTGYSGETTNDFIAWIEGTGSEE
ncbi:MAG: thioredoxin family protein [Chthoniobacterales bacterium]